MLCMGRENFQQQFRANGGLIAEPLVVESLPVRACWVCGVLVHRRFFPEYSRSLARKD